MNVSAFLGIVALLAASPQADGQSARADKPNFVVILIDDMGYGDIGPFGSKVNRTPHLDRMAREGMKLTSFYAAPVCTPSRAQMMTGCYAVRVSLPDVLWPGQAIGLSPNEQTVADLLKKQGYATMCIGKWHLGDRPDFLPTRHGFDHYLGLPYSNDMAGRNLPLLRDTQVIERPPEQDKLTAKYTDEAVKFITDNRDHPFFLYLPHTAVHVPLHPGKAFQGHSANGAYGDWVEEVDWSTGRILDTLVELKLDRRTLVLFTSDNGPWLSKGKDGGVAGPLKGGKGSTHEGGVREPTLAWWPDRVPAGSVCDAVASEMDVLPTLVKLAGGRPPADRVIDGRDIWPLLSGQSKESPHEALFYFNSTHLEAVRSGPWKLAGLRWWGDQGKPSEANKTKSFTPILFNLDADIGETTNVAKQHPDVVQRLLGYVKQIDADLGAGGKGPGCRPPGQVSNRQAVLVRTPEEYD